MFELNGQSGIAIARLIVTIAAATAATFGWSLDADFLFNIALTIIALAVLVWTWWKNNNITKAAQETQQVLNEIKQAEKAGDDYNLDSINMGKVVMTALEKASK